MPSHCLTWRMVSVSRSRHYYQGIQNVLEVARLHALTVLAPSTIAVFGATTPRDNTPDVTVCEPSTMAGADPTTLAARSGKSSYMKVQSHSMGGVNRRL